MTSKIYSLWTHHFTKVLFVFLSISYFSVGTYRNRPYKVESDGMYYYHYLVSFVKDKDFDFSNNYKAHPYPWMVNDLDVYRYRDMINPSTDRPINEFTVGPAILWYPFYKSAFFTADVLRYVHYSIDTNLYGKYYQYSIMFSAVIYGTLSLWLLIRILSTYFPLSIAQIALWIMLIASPLYYYIVVEPSMSHVYDFFIYVLYLFLFLKTIQSNRFLLYPALGVCGAISVLVRTQNLLPVTVFSLLLIILKARSCNGNRIVTWLVHAPLYLITLIAGMLPIPLLNNYLYGELFVIPQGRTFLHPFHPKIVQVLFSGRNGLFSHHPLLLFGLIGFIVMLYKTQPKIPLIFFATLLTAFFLQVYTNSIVSDWWAGHAFGQRRLISSLPLFAFGFAYLLEWVSSHFSHFYKRWLFVTILVITILNFYLVFIHIFIWDYYQPHNIFAWMFWHAPGKILWMLGLD